MERLLWVCVGGGIGSGARYLISTWAAGRFGGGFPAGTFIVNIVGCFIIAAIMHAALSLGWSPTLRAALTVGFVGGLTTYSSFNYETTRLIEDGARLMAIVNVGATLIGGFAAGMLGLWTARVLIGR